MIRFSQTEHNAKNRRLPSSTLCCQGGRMSQYLDRLAVGQAVDVSGPYEQLAYLGGGRFRRARCCAQRVVSVALGPSLGLSSQDLAPRTKLRRSPECSVPFMPGWPGRLSSAPRSPTAQAHGLGAAVPAAQPAGGGHRHCAALPDHAGRGSCSWSF